VDEGKTCIVGFTVCHSITGDTKNETDSEQWKSERLPAKDCFNNNINVWTNIRICFF